MESQESVWDKEYGRRGTQWSPRKMSFPLTLEGKVVLEVGFGTGKTLSGILEQKPKEVVAVDFSVEALKRCEKSFKDFKGVSFLKADLLKLPFDDNKFDVVVVYYVLDNLLEEDRNKAVSEVHRVVKSGGKILFEDFAVGDFRETTSKRVAMPEPHTLLKKKGLLCHYFTKAEVQKLFKDFSKVEVSEKERRPIRNKNHLVRKTLSAVAVK